MNARSTAPPIVVALLLAGAVTALTSHAFAQARASRRSLPGDLDADVATFRAWHGAPWTPAQVPAIHAMRRIFDRESFVGWSFDEVSRVLGPASSRSNERGARCVLYVRHMGELGGVRSLCGDGRFVRRSVWVPTQ